MPKDEEEKLLALLCSLDPVQQNEAFETIYRHLGLRKMARSAMGKHPLPTDEDFKEIWHRTLEGLMDAVEKGRFLGKSKFSTYIIGIVKHKWWAELKRTGRFDPIEWLSKNKEGEPDEDFELGLADTDEEYQQIIAEAIPQLGERCQGMLKDALAGRNSDFLIEKYQFSSKEMAKKESYRCRERLENIIRSKPALHQKLKDLMCRK